MKKEPKQILEQWMDCVRRKDVEGLLAQYSESAILIPTFSNRVLSTPEAIRDYFVRLSTRQELSIALHDNTLRVQAVSDNLSCICGIYCWRMEIDGDMFSFEARFSYFVDLAAERPILHHHSSQIPRMI